MELKEIWIVLLGLSDECIMERRCGSSKSSDIHA